MGRRDRIRCTVSSPLIVAVIGMLAVPVGAVRAADIELGAYVASECMTCHRPASATGTIPRIDGLSEMHISEVIKAYRDKALPNPVMQNIAGRLSDEEIASVALYFAQTRTR